MLLTEADFMPVGCLLVTVSLHVESQTIQSLSTILHLANASNIHFSPSKTSLGLLISTPLIMISMRTSSLLI